MAAIQTALSAMVDWLLRSSWQAGLLALVVLLATSLPRRWLSASARYALLLLVAARLLMPMAPRSSYSIFNLLHTSKKPAAVQVNNQAPASGDWVITKKPFSQQLAEIPADSPRAMPQFTWQTIFAICWLLGVLFMVMRIARANLKLSRRLRHAIVVDDPAVLRLLASCQSQLNIHRSLPILQTDAIHSPALMGLFRPRLLLPMDLRQRLSEDELRFVFLHELAHLKRHDIAIDWCLAILQTLHWFNPLIALAFARARTQRELARDAMVLAATTPVEQSSYGQTIVKLVESFARLGPQPGTIGILEGNSGKIQLKRRIIMIANFQRPMPAARILALAITTLLAIALLTDRKATAADRPKNNAAAAPAAPKDLRPPAEPAATGEPAEVGLPSQKADADPDGKARDAAAQAILDRKVPEIHFNAVALGDVVDFLRDVTGANISVNWKALAAAGIDKTAPVSTRMRDIQFSKALNVILHDVGGDAVKLGYQVDQGVILITTLEEIEKNTVMEVYDVRDLLASKDEKAMEEAAKKLTQLIEDTIDSQTWTDNGGSNGVVRYLKGQLIVTQTKANQKQVTQLLDRLREAHSVQVSVHTHLISVPRAIAKDMGLDIQQDGLRLVKNGPPAKGAKPVQAQFLDDKQVATLLKGVQANPDSAILTSPRLTLFNGQQGSIQLGNEIPYITGWTAPKDGKREPQIAHAKTGFLFTLQSTVSADRKYVTCNLQPRIVTLRKMDEVPWPQSPADQKLIIQKPDLAVQEVDETVSIPDGGTLLTILGESDQNAKDPKALVNILLIRPSIIIQREVEQKEPPAPKNQQEQ